MNRIITFDIETNYLLNEDGIDYSSMPYKLKDDFKIHCICAEDVKTKEQFEFVQEDCIKFIDFLKEECTYILQYNGIDFDLMVLRLYFGMEYKIQPNAHKRLNINDPYEKLPDKLFNKPVRFLDLMILSKVLNPDRFPGHALEDWGKTLKYGKGDYGKQEGAWDRYSEEMLTYCKRDVSLTTKVYEALLEEAGRHDWREAYDLEMCIRDIVSSKSQHIGFKLNKELAEWCVDDLQTKMKTIEDKIEPLLPSRVLPKGSQLSLPKVIWKKPFDYNSMFKKTGGLKKSVVDYLNLLNIDKDKQEDYINKMFIKEEIDDNIILVNKVEKLLPKHFSLLTASAINFCKEKLSIENDEEMFKKIVSLEGGEDLPILEETMRLSNKADVKAYLITCGWEPTNFNDRDLTVDSNKRKRNKAKYIEAVEKYVDDTLNGVYCKYRCEFLKVKPEELKDFLLKKKRNRPVKVLSTPKYIKNQDKDLCNGLVKLGKEYAWVNDLVKWLTYDHRLNTIKSPKGTGWLNEKRLEQDGHISTPADTIGAITGRFTHRKIVNCPRVTSLYGEYMRSMLMVDDNCYQLGFDADGLEARAEAALVYKYPGGPEYVEKLVGEKPNDLHTLNSKKFGVSRDDSKTLKYSCGYGAGAPKVAKQTGWSIEKASKIIQEYWEEAKPAKLLIERITQHWEDNNKLFIIGIDKRKLLSRAPHVLFNLALQNLGVVAMKRAHIFCDRWMKEEGLLGDPFENDINTEAVAIPIIMMHDEQQQSVNKQLVRLKYFETEEEAKSYKKEIESEGKFILSDIGKSFEEPNLNKYFVGWCKVGELMVKGLLAAGEYYNLPIKLTSGYQIGKSWKDCH
jgi:DNA polymerase III epsilon subunit-like protein